MDPIVLSSEDPYILLDRSGTFKLVAKWISNGIKNKEIYDLLMKSALNGWVEILVLAVRLGFSFPIHFAKFIFINSKHPHAFDFADKHLKAIMPDRERLAEFAVTSELSEVILWLLLLGNKELNHKIRVWAAGYGKLSVLKLIKGKVPICSCLAAIAAFRGRLEVLIWLREEKFPFSDNTISTMLNNAFMNKHVDICDWLILNFLKRGEKRKEIEEPEQLKDPKAAKKPAEKKQR